MELDLYALVGANPALGFFLIVGFGYLIGDLKIGGFQFGSSTGVLVVALIFGHLGFKPPESTESIGFMLFIYCVGLQAGPQFFSAFREQGAKFLSLAVVTAGVGVCVAVGLARLFGFAPGFAAGLLAGALTSTPTLVAARDAVQNGMVSLPPGVTPAIATGNVTVSYAITYLFGLVGMVVLVSVLPRLLGIDLAREAAKLAREGRMFRAAGARGPSPGRQAGLRTYRVVNEQAVQRTLGELRFFEHTGCLIERVRRGETLIAADSDTRLASEDIVAVVGPLEGLAKVDEFLGPEVVDQELLGLAPESRDVVVTMTAVVGRSIQDLDATQRYGCFVTSVTRAGIELEVGPDLTLQRSDILTVTGMKSRLEQFVKDVGHMERDIHQTDLVTFALGMAAGIFVGLFSLKVGQISVGLGTAGGLLISGLTIGFLHSVHPTFGRVPQAARYVLMELGLLFFMASIGVRAGADIVETLASTGPLLVLSGALVTIVPVLVAFAVGRYILGLHPAILMGGITGAMTSTPALSIVTKQAGNSVPVIGYAGTYTFANVILAFAGSLLMRLQ
jgi:putative transport protein